jgi:hypothetical protein
MERTQLLGRELSYLFSFDLPLVTEDFAGDKSGPLYATRVHSLAPDQPKQAAPVYNALGEERTLGEPAIRGHVRMADQRVDYPAGLEYALLHGRIVICTESGDVLEASYSGSLSAEDRWQLLIARRGADQRLRERFETKAFIATRFDTASTRCRWLVKCMCLGYGRIAFGTPGQPAFASFDMYTMTG